MEAEQSSYYREYPAAFGQKREIVGVGQSDTANNTLCRYCFQVHLFLAKKAPGTPVFGHCPYLISTEDATAVRRTLQRLHIDSSRNTVASSTWSNPQNEGQLIDLFYSLLAASICCHRGRHRYETVIHGCLQPTRGLCVKAYVNVCVRPSGARLPSPTTQSEGLLLRVGTLPCASTFNRFGLAQPHECSSKAATCHANSIIVQAVSSGI